MSRGLLEAASWRLASELHRRHPDLLRLAREHPGGGQYDCLALRSEDGANIQLNRHGTIQVTGRQDGAPSTWEPAPWAAYLAAPDPREFVGRVERAAGLATHPTPPSTSAVLVHRSISALTSLQVLAEPLTVEQGYIDSSGYSAGPSPWMAELTAVPPTLRKPLPEDPFDQPGYRFWRVTSSNLWVAFETSTGTAWGRRGDAVDLADAYRQEARKLPRLLALVMSLAS